MYMIYRERKVNGEKVTFEPLTSFEVYKDLDTAIDILKKFILDGNSIVWLKFLFNKTIEEREAFLSKTFSDRSPQKVGPDSNLNKFTYGVSIAEAADRDVLLCAISESFIIQEIIIK